MGEVKKQSIFKMDFSGMMFIEVLGNVEGIDLIIFNVSGIFVICLLKGEGGCGGKIVNIYQFDMFDVMLLVMVMEF